MEALLDWLIGEPGAVWVTGTLLLVVTLIGLALRWVRRERPPRVVIQETGSIRLLDIHPSQRDRLRVSYVDEKGIPQPVEDLRQKEIVIYNDGTRDIMEPMELRLRFVDPRSSDRPFPGLWWWLFDETKYSATQLEEEETVQMGSTTIHKAIQRGVRIELPYLNSFPLHGDYVAAHLVSDGEVDIVLWGKVAGRGWSAHYTSPHELKDMEGRVERRLRLASGSLMLLAVGLMLAGLVWTDVSSRDAAFELAMKGSLPFLLAIAIPSRWMSKQLSRRYLHIQSPSKFSQTSS